MKKQSEKKLVIWTRLCMLVAVLLIETALFQQTSLVVNAQGKAKVTASSGKIRESADTDSEVLASVKDGDKLDVIAQTTDSDGYTWYKVYVDDSTTGYIRADLVGEVSGTIKTESASDSSEKEEDEKESEEESGAKKEEDKKEEDKKEEDKKEEDKKEEDKKEEDKKEEDKKEEDKKEEPVKQEVQFVQVNASTASAGKVIGAKSVNVRENPSTSAAVAGKANEGTEVAISGEATDNAGKIWYQVSFSNTTGFIRSDYIEVLQSVDTVEVEEEPTEAVAEEIEETPVEENVNREYELVFEANAEGVEEWFLYDHNRGTKQSLQNLLNVVRQTQEEGQNAVSQLKTFKLLAVVMVAFILALIIVVTILVFKLRDAYEYEYEDDEEDEDDDEEDDGEEDDDEDEDEEEFTARKPLFKKASQTPVVKARQEEEIVKVSKPAQKAEPETKDTSWQSKNFLDIDDDMEFEFLDLK